MRLMRIATLLAGTMLALPVTCARSGDGLYTGGIQPSPASRVNPFESGLSNGGGSVN